MSGINTTIDKVDAVSAELLKDFDQISVLIQANETKTEFYFGRPEMK